MVPASGVGAVLLMMPDNNASGFEGWRMLTDDNLPRGVTFEGRCATGPRTEEKRDEKNEQGKDKKGGRGQESGR